MNVQAMDAKELKTTAGGGYLGDRKDCIVNKGSSGLEYVAEGLVGVGRGWEHRNI